VVLFWKALAQKKKKVKAQRTLEGGRSSHTTVEGVLTKKGENSDHGQRRSLMGLSFCEPRYTSSAR